MLLGTFASLIQSRALGVAAAVVCALCASLVTAVRAHAQDPGTAGAADTADTAGSSGGTDTADADGAQSDTPLPRPRPRPGNLEPPAGLDPIRPGGGGDSDASDLVLPAPAGGDRRSEGPSELDTYNPLWWLSEAGRWLDREINGGLRSILLDIKNEEAEQGRGWLEIHPRYRIRPGERVNFDLDNGIQDYDHFVEERITFDLHFHTSLFDLHIQIHNAVDYTTNKAQAPREDEWDISQLWLQITAFDGAPIRFPVPFMNTWVRVGAYAGRAPLTVSRGRLIGSDEWILRGSSFESAALAFQDESGPGAFSFIYAQVVTYRPRDINNQQNADANQLYIWMLSGVPIFGRLETEAPPWERAFGRPGAMTHWEYPLHNNLERRLGHGFDAWVLVLHHPRRDIENHEGHFSDMQLVTIGARAGVLLDSSYMELEANIQTGDRAGDGVLAFAVHGELQLGFELLVPVVVELVADIASGDDDQTDNTFGTFNDHLPNLHGRFGLIDLLSWRNLIHLGAGLRFELLPRLVIRGAFHLLLTVQSSDAVYGYDGSPLAPATSSVANDIGVGIDAEVQYHLSDYVRLLFGWSLFTPGERLEEAGLGDDTHYWYAQFEFGF